MPLSSIPPNLSTSQYQHLVLEALQQIAGPGSTLMPNPPILSTADFRHLVLHALNYIAINGAGGGGGSSTLPPYNLVDWSEDFTQSFWVKANVTVTPNVAIAPDGAALADGLFETTANDYHALAASIQIPNLPSNSVPNSQLVGAQAGDAVLGLQPCGWLPVFYQPSGSLTGITATITLGTEDGLSYVDVRYQGTPNVSNGTLGIYWDNGIQGTAAAGSQVWTSSIYVKQSAGTTAGISSIVHAITQNAVSSYITSTTSPVSLAAPGVSLASQRIALSTPLTDPSCASIVPFIDIYLDGNPLDFTIRIAAPQLERNPLVSQYVPTTGTPIPNQGLFTTSIFAKANGRTKFATQVGIYYAEFDLAAQTTSISPGAPPNNSSSITSVGNGWFRCVYTALGSPGDGIQFSVLSDGGSYTYPGNSSMGVYLWGAQLVYGNEPLKYIKTTSAAAAGGPPTGAAGGVLTGTYPNPSLAAGIIPTTLPPSGAAGGSLAGVYPNPTIAPGIIPTTLPPSGPAGGSLSGNYPNPTIAAGIIPTTLPPSGAAGGDLAGNYPNPTIKASVALSGTPTAPTATAGDNTTQIATTQFVQSALTSGTGSAQILIANVVNAEATALTRGTVVYAFGSVGNKLSVKRADNTSDATSATTLGFINEASVAAGAQGTVTVVGSMDQLNLGSPFVDGDSIYLGTNGGYQKTKPVAPEHNVFLGVVERANSGNGIAYVKVQNGYELDELHDVLITSETAGQALVRNAGNTLWINKTLVAADISGAAPLASPTFTGTPNAPTAAVDSSSTQIATTQFVVGQASSATVPLVNGVAAIGSSLRYARADHVHPTDSTRAPLVSPAFSGSPSAPTQLVGSDTTAIATTQFVQSAISKANFFATINGTSGLFNTNNNTDYVMPWNTLVSNTDTGVIQSPGNFNVLIIPGVTSGAGEWYLFEMRYTSFDITNPDAFMRVSIRSSSSLILSPGGGTLRRVLAQGYTGTALSGEASMQGSCVLNVTAQTYFVFTFFHTLAPTTGYPVFGNTDGLQPYIYIRRLGI